MWDSIHILSASKCICYVVGSIIIKKISNLKLAAIHMAFTD